MNKNSKAIYVEPTKSGYRATFGNSTRIVAAKPTQKQTIAAAHKAHPDAAVHVARVRDTVGGNRDKFRKVH